MKISITCITPVLQAILDFFPDIISFQHVFHLGVGRSQIEWKLKAKTQILVFPWAKIGQNDHSNPYIESTTVLSDMLPSFHLYTCLYVSIFQHEPSSIDFRHSGEERCSRKLVAPSTPAPTTEEKSAFLAGLQHVFPKAAVLSSFFPQQSSSPHSHPLSLPALYCCCSALAPCLYTH